MQRSTPGQAYRALPKAGPARTPHGYYRLRYDHVDAGGKVSIGRAVCHLRRDSDISYVATQDTVELKVELRDSNR